MLQSKQVAVNMYQTESELNSSIHLVVLMTDTQLGFHMHTVVLILL